MEKISKQELTAFIRSKSRELAFDVTGIAPAGKLSGQQEIFSGWLKNGMNGRMAFLECNISGRFDPSLLFPGSVSVIVTGLRYGDDVKQGGDGIPVLSRYAYGKDYHEVISGKLKVILHSLIERDPSIAGMVCVDSSSIHEKSWAVEAGIGWQGRNSLVINERIGSFFFLGILLLNRELEYDKPSVADRCGQCRLCMDACPTMAINDNRTIDARKCISYHTIENKGQVPPDLSKKFRGKVFGCDICQEVCPWNREPGDVIPEFRIQDDLLTMTAKEWVSMTPEKFSEIFGKSPAGRIKYERMMRNVAIAISSAKKKG